jgi:hypothetical protein
MPGLEKLGIQTLIVYGDHDFIPGAIDDFFEVRPPSDQSVESVEAR